MNVFALVFLFAATKVAAQTKDGQERVAMKRFSGGCYQTGIESDGFLRLNADNTFSWTKSSVRTGTWEMKKVMGIPFQADVIVLKFADSRKKEKYSIDVPGKAIAIRGGWLLKETECK
jgi:hypothetical protein